MAPSTTLCVPRLEDQADEGENLPEPAQSLLGRTLDAHGIVINRT